MEKRLLSDIYFYQEGPGVRKWQFTDSGVKLLNVGNINSGKINLDSTSIYISEEEANGKYNHFLIDEGDLLIACSGIVVENFHNKIAFIEKAHLPLCLNTSTMRFKELPAREGSLKFLKYFLQTRNFKTQIGRLITGSAQLNFGPSHIRQIQIPLPSLAEQKTIAAKLDKAQEIIRYNEEIIAKYDALMQALFLDMFGDPVKNEKGWEKVKLGDLGDFKNGLNYTKSENGITLKILGVGDFKNYWKIDNLENLSFVEMNIMPNKDFILQNEDLIFVRSNGNKDLVGRCLVIYPKEETISYSGFCIRFRKNTSRLNVIYLVQLLQRTEFKKHIFKNGRGANIQNINQELLNNVEIQLPPIERQNQFAARVSAIESQKQQAQESLAKSQELFNSLLQQSFKSK